MNAELSPTVAILHELEQLGRAPATDINHLQHTQAFLRFVEACQTQYPQVASALRQLGLACLVGGEGSGLAASASDIRMGSTKAYEARRRGDCKRPGRFYRPARRTQLWKARHPCG